MPRHLLHLRARERQREILALSPQRQEVAVVLAAGLAGLAGGARYQGAVPVGEVEELAVAGAVDLAEALVVAGVVGRVTIAAALDWAEVEGGGEGGAAAGERMLERGGVQLAPVPAGWI